MDLVEFEAGSLVLSSDVNNNFNYLDSKIKQLNAYITNRVATFISTISGFRTSLGEVLDKMRFFVPVGAILIYPSTEIPEGYLPCDGEEYSRTDYPDLFDVVGNTFGTPGSPASFVMPNITPSAIFGAPAANEKYSVMIKY